MTIKGYVAEMISPLSATQEELISEIQPVAKIKLAACRSLSVHIDLSIRVILKWRSQLPLNPAFAFLLMQEEMDCGGREGREQ